MELPLRQANTTRLPLEATVGNPLLPPTYCVALTWVQPAAAGVGFGAVKSRTLSVVPTCM
jgi:hypothetical protein